MSIFLLLLLIIGIKDAEFGRQRDSENCLSVPASGAVKGLFTILILFSHFASGITRQPLDSTYFLIRSHLDQAVVIPYLFFSGYGMATALNQKGTAYLRTIMTRRIPRLLLGMAAALACYWVLGLVQGRSYAPDTILLSLVGWANMGNSNWYIFGILGAYIAFWLAFQPLRLKDSPWIRMLCLLLTGALMTAFVLWIRRMDRPVYCYNTLLVFPMGVAWGLYHRKLSSLLHGNDVLWLLGLLLAMTVYRYSFLRRGTSLTWYTVWCAAFTAVLVLLLMRVRLGSPVLRFFGNHVFSIYILQRIPMRILGDHGWPQLTPYTGLILVLVSTCLMAVAFDWAMKWVYQKLHLGK